MNTQFNTIETIRTDASIINKVEAYLNACNDFEIEASKYADNESFISRKSSEEVSLSYENAKNADCEYSVYSYAHACEMWLSKAWNNAE
jgi:hypothetical protein